MSLDHSGLHHLAAVAELKQQEEEEEMMEVSAGPGLHQTEAVMMEVTGGLGGGDTPRSATPTNCHTLGPSCSAPAPLSPDSAIHSTIYSPSASPVTSRHGLPLSGFSSPYPTSSLKTSPSLSRPCIHMLVNISARMLSAASESPGAHPSPKDKPTAGDV